MLYEDNIPVISRIRRFMSNVTEILPNIYQVTYRGANVYIILEDTITIIDTGLRDGAEKVLEFFHEIGRTPKDVGLIIVTHNHIDHMGGLSVIREATGAKLAAHRLELGEREHPPSADSRYRDPVAFMKGKLRSLFSILPEDVDHILEGGETFNILGGIEIIHTPGHTPGSISIYANKHKLMMTGDLIRKHGKKLLLPPKMVSSSLTDNLESVKKIIDYDFEILCFGHGLPLRKDSKLRLQTLIESEEV